ncbi:MAG: hypothetical protein IPH64_03725 [Comamonadaceae bacterium]|nr:hypothetical protein [Comamonadaceae bacterium]
MIAPGVSGAGFRAAHFRSELDYLRTFTRTEIATRSVEEMRRISRFSDARAEEWQAPCARAARVRKGDSITGLHLPGTGVRFLLNGKPYGEVRPRVCPLFFGIWQSPATSNPRCASPCWRRSSRDT